METSGNTDSSFSGDDANQNTFALDVTLEIKEEDSKGNFNPCPVEKNFFKLRSNVARKVCVSVQQVCDNNELFIERCFGLLVSPERNVRHGDLHLLEALSMTTAGERKAYTIVGNWDPTDPAFDVLNTETPRDSKVYMTVAVDLVILGIQEPVRFTIETKAKIFPQNERFWVYSKKSLVLRFHLRLNEIKSKDSDGMREYEVAEVVNLGEVEVKRPSLLLNLRNPISSWQAMMSPTDPDDDSDNDEPLLSGSGEVSKDCKEGELDSWKEVLEKWRLNLRQRPRQLAQLVHKGIPEALRGEVWQLLSGAFENSDQLLEVYRSLIAKESPCEQVILRDINRTFPANEFFKESGGRGQDSLYRISKAYAIHDEEVGYCQGLSFLAAALLLHMPEEQAFAVLTKIMFSYNLRSLFKDYFEALHLKLFQLEKLIQDYMPDLYDHFQELTVETHMFGSQWFLTLFTAKFPLFLVFHILDVFLCEGMDSIFKVSLALLLMSKKELLSLDFEGVLKYFRVSLPKKYRHEETARLLIRTAVGLRISVKKLTKYEREYFIIQEQKQHQEDPVKVLTQENQRLMKDNMRLEHENDNLAHVLITKKLELRRKLDEVEDRAEVLSSELEALNLKLVESEEEKKRLAVEATQVKEMCRRELQNCEAEITRNRTIITDYKQICNQMSARLEKEQIASQECFSKLWKQMRSCDSCRAFVEDTVKNNETCVSNSQIQFKKLIAMNRDSSNSDLEAENGEDIAIGLSVQVRELELELAKTKLALVETECHNQDLTHQLNSTLTALQSSRNTWFQKTLTSIRDVAKKENVASVIPSIKSSSSSNSEGFTTLKDAKDDGLTNLQRLE
ncbi:hypothetical protein CHUAL_009238 [Chamberlinius hualienensis]